MLSEPPTLTDLTQSLNPAQEQAVLSESKHLRVLAGAGSGKTRVLVHRIAWLLSEKGLSPNRVLAVTFTNKAAQEMRRRIELLIGIPTHTMWVGTFHGIAHRLLRQHAQEAGLPQNFQIIDSDDQLRLIKRLIQESGFDDDELDPRRTQGFINRQKDEGKRAKELGQAFNAEASMMIEIYRSYEAQCERAGMVDFAELLLRVYEMWQKNPAVLASYRSLFQHVLVDEFQDTNTIQYLWLQSLCGPDCSVTIVGDDDQSIYGWRGAKIENIHRFSRDFGDSETVRLEQNYRSTGSILNAANSLIKNNEDRLGKELWTDMEEGEKITLYGGFNELDEARFITERIKHWLQMGGAYQEVAILYRSNAQSRVLEQALRSNQMPYKIYGGLRFFDRAEIKDALGYLRLLVNVNDDPAFERVINYPPRGIGDRTMMTIREEARARQISLWNAARSLLPTFSQGRISKGLNQFFDVIGHLLQSAKDKTLSQLVQEVLEATHLLAHVKAQPGERTFAKLENMQELITATAQFAEDRLEEGQVDPNAMYAEQLLPQFLSDVALDAGERDGEEDQNSIKMMTLHSAKGLEFPLVFMAGLEEGLFPHHRCSHAQELLEEERRLCYVGITRAMKKLYVTYAEKRTFAGNSGLARPSRFIKEIPSQLIETLHLNAHIQPPMSSSGSSFRRTSSPTSPRTKKTMEKASPYQLGQPVHHPKFGQGVVIGAEGSGDLARVQVNFKTVGAKWLVISYAKLTPL